MLICRCSLLEGVKFIRDIMADLNSDIRLAVDSGKTAIGANEVIRALKTDKAKLVIVAATSSDSSKMDINHLAKLGDVKVITFGGNPIELGAVCGKPYSVSTLAIIEAGNSNILNI
jgi:large subunit ribosomal protein L30e